MGSGVKSQGNFPNHGYFLIFVHSIRPIGRHCVRIDHIFDAIMAFRVIIVKTLLQNLFLNSVN